MSDSVMYILLVAGILISAVLMVVIYRQVRSLRRKQEERLANQENLERIQKERYEYIESSLNILTDALMNSQIGVVEGAIRVKSLLDYYNPALNDEPAYAVFTEIHEQTEHIPIKEAWKKLEKPIRRKHELFMARLEIAHGEEVVKAAGQLHAHINKAKQ
ncbi:DUF2489 domain-containing protein [Neptunomonas phycophila]|uniref:DUF2489 domain-containing protein n=1 Tax=Neptunomonas phycophila TaxID=1572645 RepID=A0ABT9EWT1_9GAMM|nr:DUF2489 domain-containing protein [Neptunomonas phycophila]MDP2523515.1 DUF2489 domain-containing protein [Neptunomonas phycophila]